MGSIQTFTERRMAVAAVPYFITVIKSFWCFFESKEMVYLRKKKKTFSGVYEETHMHTTLNF